PSAARRHWRPRTPSCAGPAPDLDARSPNRCETGSAAPPRRARQDRVSSPRACDRAPGRPRAQAAPREAAITWSCPTRTPRPLPLPRRDERQTRRRGNRAGCRTICSGLRRAGGAHLPRAPSWRASRDIDAKAEAVTLESERFVEGVRAFALGVRGQHQLVAALVATKGERELHHRLADAVALQRRRHGDILDDPRRR